MAVRVTDSNGLVWKAGIDDSELNKTAARIESRISGMGRNVQQEGDKLDNTFKKLAGAAAAFFTLQQGSQLVNGIIKVRGEFQQLEIAFGTMLQSKEKADRLMSEAVQLAATTPFGLQDVASGAKQLLAYGFAAEDITDNITRLGNIASGVGSQLNDLIYLYGTLKASGRVTQMDINQFAGRGIPIYEALSKVLGVATDKVREMVSAGQVGFPQIEKAFKNLTDNGGMFYNLMAEQSKSLTGQIANLQDNISLMFNEIGKSNQGLLSSGISGIAYLVENYKEIGKILGVLISTYGGYRAALILESVLLGKTAIATGIYDVATKRLIVSKTLLASATNIVAAAQTRLAAVFAMSPIGLVVTAVAALGAAYYFLSDRTTEAERSQKGFNEAIEKSKDAISKVKSESSSLLSVINNEAETREAQLRAFAELQKLYPDRLRYMSLEELKIKDVADQQRILNAELDKFRIADLETRLQAVRQIINDNGRIEQSGWEKNKEFLVDVLTMEDSLAKRKQDAINIEKLITKEIADQKQLAKEAAMSDSDRVKYYNEQKTALEKQIASFEQFNGKLARTTDGTIDIGNNLAAWSISGVINQFNTLIGKINSVNAVLGADGSPIKTISTLEDEIKDLREKRKSASLPYGTGRYLDKTYLQDAKHYDDIISRKEKELKLLSGTTKEAHTKAVTKATTSSTDEQQRAIERITDAERQATIDRKVEGEKQVAEIQERFRKMREEAAKSGVKDLGKINALEKQALDDNTYSANTKAIQEYLEKQKKLYEDYESYKAKVGEEAARKEFADKIDLNNSYYNILKTSKQNFEADQKGKVATNVSQDRSLLINRAIADEEEKRLQKQRDDKAKAIEDFATYEQKRAAIIKASNDKIAALGSEATEHQKQEAERQKKIALGQLADDYAGRLLESKSFFTGLVLNSKQAVEAQIKNIEALLRLSNLDPETRKKLIHDLEETKKLLKVDVEDLELVQLKKELEEIDEQLRKMNPEAVETKADLMVRRTQISAQIAEKSLTGIEKALSKISKYQEALGDLGATLSAIGGEGTAIGETGAALSTLASGMGNLVSKIKELKTNGATSTDAYVAAAQFVLQLTTAIIDASKRRKEAERNFLMDAIGLQNQYNLALNEQLRLQAELSESIFSKDYFGRAKSGMEAAIDAAKKYQDAIAKLNEGKAKERQKNVVDGKTVGQLALSGAAAGAVIGAAVGVGVFSVPAAAVGAIIGGLVGAIGGLFAKKKKDVFGGLLEQWPELIKETKEGYKEINVELAKSLMANNQLDDKTKALVQNVLDTKDAYEAARKQVTDIVSELAGSLGNDLKTALVDAWKAGEDSAKAFGETVDKILENIISNLVFNAVFGETFKKLQTDLENDFIHGTAADITDTMGDFFEKNKGNIDKFNEAMKIANEQAKEAGLSAFTQNKSGSTNTLKGSIQASLTEETGTILAGVFKGVQLNTLELVNINKSMEQVAIKNLDYAVQTANNTYNTVSELKAVVVKLTNIDNNISKNADAARAAGF